LSSSELSQGNENCAFGVFALEDIEQEASMPARGSTATSLCMNRWSSVFFGLFESWSHPARFDGSDLGAKRVHLGRKCGGSACVRTQVLVCARTCVRWTRGRICAVMPWLMQRQQCSCTGTGALTEGEDGTARRRDRPTATDRGRRSVRSQREHTLQPASRLTRLRLDSEPSNHHGVPVGTGTLASPAALAELG
jgi:hypothetical protein